MKKKRWLASILAAGLILGLLAGCQKSSETSGQAKDGVQTIIVGSGNGYKPYCYLDEEGKAVGYEYDILKALDEKMEDYEFQYETMSFDNLLLSLDSGKIQVAAHQYEYTKEREEKYLFSKESYTEYVTYVAVLAENNDIKGIDDLGGKKVLAGGTTSAANQQLVNYNEEHPDNPINITNRDNNKNEQTVAELQSGAIDAVIFNDYDTADLNKEYGDGKDILKVVGEPVNDTDTYYVFSKENTKLQEAFDTALAELRESGTLTELSEKWLGGDFTGSK